MTDTYLLDLVSGTASATDTNNATIIAAQSQGEVTKAIYVTDIIISNTSGTDSEVLIKAGTTTKLVYPAPAHSGAVHTLNSPLRIPTGEVLAFASADAVSTMKVSALGFLKRK